MQILGRLCINVGCGTSPTAGWVNFDNSIGVRVSRIPFLAEILHGIGIISDDQSQFIRTARVTPIYWADVAKRIPFPDNSADVIYSSHMLEHLDLTEAQRFIAEARRVLAPKGILRIAVPDLKRLVDRYISDGDADKFVASTLLATEHPSGVVHRIKRCFIGERHHLWMYDSASLRKLVESAGFTEICDLEPGATTIADSSSLNLREREDESIYLEAAKS